MLLRSTAKPPISLHKSMLLRSTTKPSILEVLTKNHISEAFRTYFVNKSVIVPPSKLIVTNVFPPRFFFIRGGVIMRGVDRTKNRHL